MTTTEVRRYEQTHPWLTFDLTLAKLGAKAWMHLGEAVSKMEHIASVNLLPDIARELHTLSVTRGVQGTAAIEGNTLSEEEVRRAVEGNLELPPSQDYLRREVVNILETLGRVVDRATGNGPQPLTTEWLCELNRGLMDGLDREEDDFVPGEIREHSVGVRLYRGAPWQDCRYLLDRLCDWLNGDFWTQEPDFRQAFTIIKANIAHLYMAWIHPFGDGNGRTARMLEFQLLIEGGVPSPAAHLLSNHFNRTRDEYYYVLDRTSRQGPPYPVEEFLRYSLEGLVDGLREQLKTIRRQQTIVTWTNFVHDQIQGTTEMADRQRALLLDLPVDRWTPNHEIPDLSIRLARKYAVKTDKTVTRDLNLLAKHGLLLRSRGKVRPNIALLRAFLPLRVQSDAD